MRIHLETRAAIILGATGLVAAILISASLVRAGLLASTASQTAPNLVAYQGYAANADSQPLTGNYDVCFKPYNVPTGGTALGTECRTGTNQVPFSNGVFNVLLGQVNLLSDPFPVDPVYLGVKVGSDPEMTPRERLGSVPYALQAPPGGKSHSYPFLIGANRWASTRAIHATAARQASKCLELDSVRSNMLPKASSRRLC